MCESSSKGRSSSIVNFLFEWQMYSLFHVLFDYGQSEWSRRGRFIGVWGYGVQSLLWLIWGIRRG